MTYCDIAIANAARDNACESSSSINIQIESSDTWNVSNLVGKNDILADDLTSNTSAIISLPSQAEKSEAIEKLSWENLLEEENRVDTDGSNDEIIPSENNANEGSEDDQ